MLNATVPRRRGVGRHRQLVGLTLEKVRVRGSGQRVGGRVVVDELDLHGADKHLAGARCGQRQDLGVLHLVVLGRPQHRGPAGAPGREGDRRGLEGEVAGQAPRGSRQAHHGLHRHGRLGGHCQVYRAALGHPVRRRRERVGVDGRDIVLGSTTGPRGVSIATPTSPSSTAANDSNQSAICDSPAPPCSNSRSPSTFPAASSTHA